MFSINDTVMYGRNGACTVKDIRVENFSGSEREYYILTPESEPNSTVYVPVDSAHIKLKRLVTKEEIADILRDGRRDAMAWQEDNRLRRESSAQIIKSGDHRRLVALIRLYRTKKKEFEDNNKKFFVADDKILKEAESTVTQEFCAVLGIDGESVIGMICE